MFDGWIIRASAFFFFFFLQKIKRLAPREKWCGFYFFLNCSYLRSYCRQTPFHLAPFSYDMRYLFTVDCYLLFQIHTIVVSLFVNSFLKIIGSNVVPVVYSWNFLKFWFFPVLCCWYWHAFIQFITNLSSTYKQELKVVKYMVCLNRDNCSIWLEDFIPLLPAR